MLESEIAQRYMSTRERYLHGRHLIDSVCCTTLSRYQDNIIVCTVLPLLAAKFFLAPSRLDDGRPRENFTAAIIPVRWLHPKPYAHHLTTSQARKLARRASCKVLAVSISTVVLCQPRSTHTHRRSLPSGTEHLFTTGTQGLRGAAVTPVPSHHKPP